MEVLLVLILEFSKCVKFLAPPIHSTVKLGFFVGNVGSDLFSVTVQMSGDGFINKKID